MPEIHTPVVAGGPPPVRSIILRDFSGGLNLRDDPMQLPNNELPVMVDVEPTPAGGLKKRLAFQGSAAFTTNPAYELKGLWFAPNENTDGTILVGARDVTTGNDVLLVYSTTAFALGAAPDKKLAFTTQSDHAQLWSGAFMKRVNNVTADNNFFIHRGGGTVSQAYLPATQSLSSEQTDAYGHYNDNFANPGSGTNVVSRIICTHLEYLFHAGCFENGARHPARIRWSHPGEPGDYRTNDFIDVGEGNDNDSIRALVSAYGALFIFKERSVWMLTGFDSNTFALNQIAWGVGCQNMNGAAMGPFGLVFFDNYHGMQEISYRRGPSGRIWMAMPMWDKLRDALTDGRITFGPTGPQVCWVGPRLYVTNLFMGGRARTFVYDATIGTGWWTIGVGGSLCAAFNPEAQVPKLMLGDPYDNSGVQQKMHIAMQNVLPSERVDRMDGSTASAFSGSFQTAWLTGGDASLKKRFRRFAVVFKNQPVDRPFVIQGFKNWQTATGGRTYNVLGTLLSGAADSTTDINVRSGTLGSGYAASLIVTGIADRLWDIQQITVRFVPMRIN